MRKIIFGLTLLLVVSCHSQEKNSYKGFNQEKHNPVLTELQGIWGISFLITSAEIKENKLYARKDGDDGYGNSIKFNADQTFISSYSAECGNDCFTTSTGKYKIIDENYICFFLEEVTQSGDCRGDSKPNEDLGMYYYYKTETGYQLLKSRGTLEKDKELLEYRNLALAQIEKMQGLIAGEYSARDFGKLEHFLNWKRTDLKEEEDIIAFCMAENNISNYEILYSLKTSYYWEHYIVLVKANSQYRYVVYEKEYYRVGLYDDSFIEPIEKKVSKINNDKSLKTKTFEKEQNRQTNPLDLKTVTVYAKNNQVHKIVCVKNPEERRYSFSNGRKSYIGTGNTTITLYLENDSPVFAERETKYEYTDNEKPTQTIKTVNYYIDYSLGKHKRKIATIPADYYIFYNDILERLLDEAKNNL